MRAALTMMRGRVDGLVVMSPHIDAETLTENLPQSLPVVLLNCYVESDRFDSLSVDNFGGAYAMTRHLLSHGHQRIAIIKGTQDNFDAAERLRGYCVAMGEGGVAIDSRLQSPGNFTEAAGYEAVKDLLSVSPRPTAIFACNDSTAIGALSALREQGIQVPEEMALAGFDDVPIAAYLTPTLTSVHVGIHDLGVKATDTVVHAVRNKNAHHKQQAVLPTRLSLRESCGCKVP
jgi:LacI family transcriptional regulator